jgi:putative ABC transport system permease protein
MKNMIKLALKSIKYRKAALVLSVISISMSVVLLLGIERIRSRVHDSFTSTISGTDLIVGARSGNISIILSNIFHIGYPNQNVSWETYKTISLQEQVEWSIPLSLGDSHKGYSVVGTTDDFFDHYEYGNELTLKSATGEACIHGKQCVLGASVSKDLGYKIGDKLVVTHGMGHEDFIKHEDEPFIIGGILQPTGTPVDQSIYVSIYAMDAIHSHFYGYDGQSNDVLAGISNNHTEAAEHHDHDHDVQGAEQANSPKSVSGFLLGLKNPADVLMVHRAINEYKDEPLTAIMPVVTLIDLWQIVQPVEATLIVISFLVLIVALGGILTNLISTLNDRRREMAIIRSIGAKPKHVFGLIMLESSAIILAGIFIGVAILYIVLFISKPIIAEKLGLIIQVGWFSADEIYYLITIFLLGVLTGVIPSYQCYKNSITDGLMINR